MFEALQRSFFRLLIEIWLEASPYSWRRRVMAHDSPHLHAHGVDPDRVLVAGDGAATGRGVVTHDLGLGGHLARGLSERLGRAVDLDLVMAADMTSVSCLEALQKIDLGRYDLVVLTLGANEAFALTSVREWRLSLGDVLDQLEAEAPASTRVFLLPIPALGLAPHFPKPLGRIVDRQVARMNATTAEVLAARPCAELVPTTLSDVYRPGGPHVYQGWAEAIATHVVATSDPGRDPIGSREAMDDDGRQEALGALRHDAASDRVVERLTETTRKTFGTEMAAVTLIERSVQIMTATSGIDPVVLPRSEAFCDWTIRRAAHFVVADARVDPRFAHLPIVRDEPSVRFYAGYPIEAPDGQRVGALCVMDREPREFTPDDAVVLRHLAQTVQETLWSGAEG